MSMARLWVSRGKRAKPTISSRRFTWFTGIDTADLVAARRLLNTTMSAGRTNFMRGWKSFLQPALAAMLAAALRPPHRAPGRQDQVPGFVRTSDEGLSPCLQIVHDITSIHGGK
jgi:hypothetical protein